MLKRPRRRGRAVPPQLPAPPPSPPPASSTPARPADVEVWIGGQGVTINPDRLTAKDVAALRRVATQRELLAWLTRHAAGDLARLASALPRAEEPPATTVTRVADGIEAARRGFKRIQRF